MNRRHQITFAALGAVALTVFNVTVDRTADVIFYDRDGTRAFTVNQNCIAKN